jgi:hypothetical protein
MRHMKLRPFLSTIVTLWISGMVFFMGCDPKKNGLPGKNCVDSLLVPFTPPPDSVITSGQMNAWFDCNPKLDSLSMVFTATLAKGKAPEEAEINRFSRVQDTICAQCGLRGGYAEYFWITRNLGSSVNRKCYDSVASRRAKQKQ